MTKSESASLLALIAAFDRRTIGETDVEAWHLIVGDLEPTDCADAVRHHYAERRDWLMPADVRQHALTTSRRREGERRVAERQRQLEAENAGELTERERPLRALMTGTPIKSAPRPTWTERRALPPRPAKPPLTDEELAAARDALAAAAPSNGSTASDRRPA